MAFSALGVHRPTLRRPPTRNRVTRQAHPRQSKKFFSLYTRPSKDHHQHQHQHQHQRQPPPMPLPESRGVLRPRGQLLPTMQLSGRTQQSASGRPPRRADAQPGPGTWWQPCYQTRRPDRLTPPPVPRRYERRPMRLVTWHTYQPRCCAGAVLTGAHAPAQCATSHGRRRRRQQQQHHCQHWPRQPPEHQRRPRGAFPPLQLR